ncbi:MAG: alpha/beta hydrolase [Leptolyngbyaceae bacterium]|nr:alpha/beta hydrolase [Leptolyngbyaceae bacterium]
MTVNDRLVGGTISVAPSVLPIAARLGGTIHPYPWVPSDTTVEPLVVATETLGSGPPLLLLPAFSTVSSRAELRDLAQGLAQRYEVTVVDWPGFGDSHRPKANYGPEFYCSFLADFVRARWSEAIAIVAAGHACGYVMALANQGLWSTITLVAPTWRGPLAVMGVPPVLRRGVRTVVRSPFIGQGLYYLNTRPAFLKWMYERHVVVDTAVLTPDYIQERYDSTQQPGARYAPAAFVTGGLDPVSHRDEFQQWVQAAPVPVTVMVAEHAPFGSKSDMEAIASLGNVRSLTFPGSLGMAEELGEHIADTILET